ncbi:beta-ketoacyl synthase chain length factor [Paraburkholderia sp. Ac-20336]|uniref:beta-ketoacyl synthase chain length factor n=1 Tax=unclassified Paraburkholderia TaxID=2615204 RepID=UPI00197F16F4|nr:MULTISPECIES: beta-ketoacyl synthase chain length factor [unclassified Paraburkholderia]MBN3806513.1 beta-ketoacyl synthase chain length factor [Paraburkholderia sp. Ac-20336]MBN3850191.1 beta-ketoacyl synthase chain length factor [Paraburkholderia sp. Ac-20342]
MPDLHWTIPVGRWSSWPATASAAPDIGFIEPIVRRRLSTLSKAALKVAHDCVAREPVRVVFASRHGELRRTTDILRSISAGEPVSPTAFSLSVLNAMTGVFGIARGDRSAASAVSAGAQTLGYALLEAYAQYATQPDSPVLLVYADEPADRAYGTIEDEVQGGALALLLDDTAAAGHIVCSLSRAAGSQPAPVDGAAANVTAANANLASNLGANPGNAAAEAAAAANNPPANPNTLAADTAATRFPTQSQALLHCLETGQPACWERAGALWHWRWHDRAA